MITNWWIKKAESSNHFYQIYFYIHKFIVNKTNYERKKKLIKWLREKCECFDHLIKTEWNKRIESKWLCLLLERKSVAVRDTINMWMCYFLYTHIHSVSVYMYNNNRGAPRTNRTAYLAVVKCGHGKTKEYARRKEKQQHKSKKKKMRHTDLAQLIIVMIFMRNWVHKTALVGK